MAAPGAPPTMTTTSSQQESALQNLATMTTTSSQQESALQNLATMTTTSFQQESALQNLPTMTTTSYQQESALQNLPTMTTTSSQHESALQNLPTMTTTSSQQESLLLEMQGRIDSVKQILESEPLNVVAAIGILTKGNGISEIEVASYTSEQKRPDNLELRLHVVMAMIYFHKFISGRQIQDLEESKICWKEAIAHQPLDACSNWWFAYAIYLNRVFEHTGWREYIDDAFNIAEKLAAHSSSPEFAYFLGSLMDRRFKLTNNVNWINQSVEMLARSLQNTPEVERLSELSEAKLDRFERLCNEDDMETSIRLAREAVEISPHEDRNRMRYNLALALTSSYESAPKEKAFSAVRRLSEAIDILQDVVQSTSTNSKFLSAYLNALGTMLMHKYERSKRLADIAALLISTGMSEDAINSMIVEVAAAEINVSECDAECFGGADKREAEMLYDLFTFEKYFPGSTIPDSKIDIDNAIWTFECAFAAKEVSMERRAGTLFNLSKALAVRHRDFGDCESKRRAIYFATKVLEMPRAPPKILYEAGMIAARYAEDDNDWNTAAALYTKIVGLIPTIISRSSGRGDYEHILRRAYGSSAAAAAAILQAGGTAGQALEVLEASRGLIASQLICSRNDVSDLALQYPEKFKEYDKLRSNVVQPLETEFLSTEEIVKALQTRERDEDRLSNLEAEIRSLPGFSRFQQAMDEKDLLLQCRGSHIVYFNVSPLRSDAICVSEIEIRDINLPNLNFDDLTSWAQFLTGKHKKTKLIPEDFVERNQDILKLLNWLWETLIKPVLGGLNLLQESYLDTQNLPHIIWIPTGHLTVFPLHAAGIHDQGSLENTLSHVVSSYASTIRSHVYAREISEIKHTFSDEPTSVLSSQDKKALVVTMTETSDYQGVSYGSLDVYDEVKALQMAFGEIVILERPSASQVLEELKRTDVVHFACHGFVDTTNPSNSALLLHDKDANAASPMTIKDIVQITHQAQIAYLSACSTAETSTIEIVDESIHLASTFQLAGFPHVIGTLWEAEDSASRLVAEEFYSRMNRQSAQDVSPRYQVARALHEAVLSYREMDREFPISWAPFVHFGI